MIDDDELERRMLQMIDDAIAFRTPFKTFARIYRDFVINDFPSKALPKKASFFDNAQDWLESVDWNAPDRDTERVGRCAEDWLHEAGRILRVAPPGA